MKNVVFTSYAFGDLYVRQQQRLRDSILKLYPDANILFWASESANTDNNPAELPPGSKTFKDSMYGFKVYCIKECLRQGYGVVIYLDAAMMVEADVSPVLKLANEIGVVCAIDRSLLYDRISDACLAYFEKERAELGDLTIVGGSLYVFDFSNEIAVNVFEHWKQMEALGLFGSEEQAARGELNGHRHDEACMAVALNMSGTGPVGFDQAKYHNLGAARKGNEVFVFYKLHFKGIGKIGDHSVNLSLLPPNANVLDLGCRYFTFANPLRELEHVVYTLDIGAPDTPGLDGTYIRIAITDKSGRCSASAERDPDATHVIDGEEIQMMTLEQFTRTMNVRHWDLIKMDIEGSEFGILKTAKHPIAKQVTVEFHAHCGQRKEDIDGLLDELSEYYFIHNRVWEEAQGSGFNYWDILLIAK